MDRIGKPAIPSRYQVYHVHGNVTRAEAQEAIRVLVQVADDGLAGEQRWDLPESS
jgi:hypothetical protein